MGLIPAISEARAAIMPALRNAFPFTQEPNVVPLINGTGGALALGDLVMLDMASTGVIATAGGYKRVIAPTVAGNLESAGFLHYVCQETVADGAVGKFLLYGTTKLNLATSSGTIGAKIGTNGTNKTGEVTTIVANTKIIGKTQVATTTGVVNVYFDGRGLGSGLSAASETVAGLVELATTAEAETGTDTARAVTPAGLKAAILGLQMQPFAATDIYVGTTTPLVAQTAEIATNSLCVNKSWDAADSGGDLIGWFDWISPKDWNASTVQFQVVWSVIAATAGPAVFALDAGAVSDADSLDLTVGTAQTSTDSSSATANLAYISPLSSAITIGGTPAKGDLIKFRIRRTSAAAGDTLAATARIIGIKLWYTTDAMTQD